MGKFDKELAYWREQHRVAVEELKDLEAGNKKMAEDTGQGWTDTSDRWKDKLRDVVIALTQLIDVYEKLGDWTPLRRSPANNTPSG
jgi:hypothetical protein